MEAFKEVWWQFLILIVCSYLLGNLNISLAISRMKKKDITKQDSGNPGAMNMYRNFGFLIGVSILLFDMVKGALPVIAAWLLFKGYSELFLGITMLSAGLFEVLGHIYPVLQKFKGGKGVASTIGVYFTVAAVLGVWYVPLAVFALAIIYIYFFEWGSVGSLMITTILPIFIIVFYSARSIAFSFELITVGLLNLIFTALSYWKHRTNLKKLANGTEHRTVLKTIFKRKAKKPPESVGSAENGEKTESEDKAKEPALESLPVNKSLGNTNKNSN